MNYAEETDHHSDHTKADPEVKKEKQHVNPLYSDDELASMVDHLLETLDKNRDGFIEWSEYRTQ